MVKQKILVARRVSYGKKATPISEREYRLTLGGPVGTKREWRAWAKEHNLKIKFVEAKK